jgi:subfamily B ATP-binding cassette protein MsbA
VTQAELKSEAAPVETPGASAGQAVRPATDLAEPAVREDEAVAAPRLTTGDWSRYRRLLRYVKPHWFVFLLAVIGFQVGSAAEAYFATMFGDLIDSWPDTALIIPALMLLAAFARGIGEIIGEILLSRISFSVVHVIRTELFDQLLYMPSDYFDASSQGHLVSRITFNVAQLRNTGTDALKTIVQDGGRLIVYVSVMVYLSWKLTLIFVATAPLVALVVAAASHRFRRISKRIQHSMGDVTQVASEAVNGYRVVRIFGGERYERERFNRSSHYNRRQNLKMVATKVTSTQVIQMFVAVALAILIAVLFQPGIGGELTTGEIVTLLGLAGMMARPLKKLTEVNAKLQQGLAAAEDVFSQLDQPREVDQGELEVDRVEGRIEFRGVNFGYVRGSGPVLKDLNLMIEPGQTVALVGKSGSGKSTLASLIPRFYEPDDGMILLDGRPLNRYRLASLRKQVALVTQEVTLFNDSLRNNIAYGALGSATEGDLVDAVRRAHADVFVDEMPDGLDTVVGDDGVLLSGGQRQRVAIARALLKDAPVLILDEATSALDSTSERHIQAALEEVMRGRTTLVIAHRLSTIENADVILVMQDGRIVESGRHAELLESGGAYAELYNSQFDEGPVPGEQDKTQGKASKAHGTVHPPSPRLSAAALPDLEQRLSPLARAWYDRAGWLVLLQPLAWVYGVISRRRRLRFLTGRKSPWRADVPVIVVGNISVGGTGKTPFVIWLVKALGELGFGVGIVSRGHGGAETGKPVAVTPDSSAEDVGDEAPMLAARTGRPVVVCRDRVKAVQTLLETSDCDLVVADDGLQHYALARDVEIALVDGHRGLGNGRLLPAGPLREPPGRLTEVDWVVSSGRHAGTGSEESLMTVRPVRLVRVGDPKDTIDGGEGCLRFARRHPNVHAVAGIGNPTRFVQTLRSMGFDPLLHAHPDHHRYRGNELDFDNDWPVICTEKDATKLRELTGLPEEVYYLEVDASVETPAGEDGALKLAALLDMHGIRSP